MTNVLFIHNKKCGGMTITSDPYDFESRSSGDECKEQ